MHTENNNIIFTVFNKKLIITLGIFTILSIIGVILFFTVIRPEYIVLGLPFVFFIFVLPIFMIGMRNKIIYRFTNTEFQFRGSNPCNILWKNIDTFTIDEKNINITLKDKSSVILPVMNFNKDEMKKAMELYLH